MTAPAVGNSADDVDSTPRRERGVLFGRVLKSRAMSLTLGIAGVSQIALTALGVGLMECPVPRVIGAPCPGCGISRACVMLLKGRFADAFTEHAAAPLFLIATLVFLIGGLLPDRMRIHVANRVTIWEIRWWPVPLLLVATIVYWAARLMFVHGFRSAEWLNGR